MSARSFGKYEVLARLATGGAASIFLARQPGAAGFQKLVVLKTLLPERASDDDFVAMFLDEARLAARLNHPNCVQIYDLGRVRGVYYISMEYIFGETLWNLLTTVTKVKQPLPTSSVAHIIAASCDGLHHAHELKDGQNKAYNLVHRDVSPQNIMITFEGQTKVLDFGIAKAETGRAPTMAGIVKGKFSYMSPEQITGGQVDRRSDIYSLGIVMFECLASRRLYRGDSPEDIARLILEHRAPRLKDVVPDIPAALDEICARALSRHPSRRYQSAQEMGEALRNHLDDLRYNQSSSSLAKLLRARFGGVIEDRRQIFEGALVANHDEQRLLELLDARKVRDIDLFPDEVSADEAKDFTETGVVPEAAVAAAAAQPQGELSDAATHNQEVASSRRGGAGWQVELDTSTSDVERISVGQPELLRGQVEDGTDATRVDQDVEGATVAGLIEPAEPTGDLTQLDSDNIVEVPLVRPADDLDQTENNLQDAVVVATHAVFGAEGTLRDPTEPLEAMVDEVLRAPSFGSAAAAIEARLAEVEAQGDLRPGDTVDVEDRDALNLVGSGDTAIAPVVPASVVLEPVVQAADPAVAVVEPPKEGLRFGIGALLAALVFGISVGIVAGMLLARVVFDHSPATINSKSGKVVDLSE